MGWEGTRGWQEGGRPTPAVPLDPAAPRRTRAAPLKMPMTRLAGRLARMHATGACQDHGAPGSLLCPMPTPCGPAQGVSAYGPRGALPVRCARTADPDPDGPRWPPTHLGKQPVRACHLQGNHVIVLLLLALHEVGGGLNLLQEGAQSTGFCLGWVGLVGPGRASGRAAPAPGASRHTHA